MTETATVNAEATSTPASRKAAAGAAGCRSSSRASRSPRSAGDVASERPFKRYGQVFAINVPFFGRTVFVSDPALVRQVFTASTDDLINVQPNLSRVFGPGSVFALDRTEHRNRRKLLAPPFHGQSIKNYEKVIEEETLRESANWPEGDGVRDPRADEQDHPERDPADGLRGRRRRARLSARDHPAVGEAGFADGGPARAAASAPAVAARGAGSTSSAATSTASSSR